MFLASERIRFGPASVTESMKSTLNRFCRYRMTDSWTRPSMQLMAVQNLMVSATWGGVGRFVLSERVKGLRQALCSHPQFVTPACRGGGGYQPQPSGVDTHSRVGGLFARLWC